VMMMHQTDKEHEE